MPRGRKQEDTIQANSFKTWLSKRYKNRGFKTNTREEAFEEVLKIFYGPNWKNKSNVLEAKRKDFKKLREAINPLKREDNKRILDYVEEKCDKEGNISTRRFANILIDITIWYSDEQRKKAQAEVDKHSIPLSDVLPDEDTSGYIAKARSLYNKIKGRIKKGISPKEVIQSLQRNPIALGTGLSYGIGIASWFLYRGGFGTTFPVVLGPVPLKHVDEIEVARSGKILKFRATGSVFLAGQKGAKDSIIVTGVLSKWEVYELLCLWILFVFGQSKVQAFNDKMFGGFKTSSLIPMGKIDFTKIRKLTDVSKVEESLSNKTYEYHATFPIVTRHFIIPNCYIETFSFEEKLPLKDTLQYTILLRTHEHHDSFSFYQEMDSDDKLTGTAYYGLNPNKTSMQGTLEFATNIIWRALGASGMWVENNEWKLGDAKSSGKLDTYYNVGFESIASALLMGVSGIT